MFGGLGRQKWEGWSWYGVGEGADRCVTGGTERGVGMTTMSPTFAGTPAGVSSGGD